MSNNLLSTMIEGIVEKLFAHEDRRLVGVIDEIETANRFHGKHAEKAFMYGGNLYTNSSADTRYIAANVPTLSLRFTNAMVSYFQDLKQIKADKASIQQMLFRLMHPCETYQDLRDALPETLVEYLPEESRKLTRTNQDGYNLPDDRARRQYAKVKERIDFYFSTSLLY